jgi:hypothetical protein
MAASELPGLRFAPSGLHAAVQPIAPADVSQPQRQYSALRLI